MFSEISDFRTKSIPPNKEGYFIIICWLKEHNNPKISAQLTTSNYMKWKQIEL